MLIKWKHMLNLSETELIPFSWIALATIFSENPIPMKWSINLELEEPADELALRQKRRINSYLTNNLYIAIKSSQAKYIWINVIFKTPASPCPSIVREQGILQVKKSMENSHKFHIMNPSKRMYNFIWKITQADPFANLVLGLNERR